MIDGIDIHERGYWLSKEVCETHVCDDILCNAIVKEYRGLNSVVDIGCGNGDYVKIIMESIYCIGYDGNPMTPYITDELCDVLDFSKPQDIGKFDLVLSLEVGEHIPKKYESIYIDNLVRAAKKDICISWAIKGQGGSGHVNCQDNDYVISVMDNLGFNYLPKRSNNLREAATISWFKNTILCFEREIL